MNREQYMKAARMKVPVVCNDIRYVRISEVILHITGEEERRAIHRNAPNEFILLRLLDRHGNSGTCVPPEKVEIDPEIRKLHPGVFDDAET